MNSNYRIGIDVGGSHFSASVIAYDAQTPNIISSATQGIDSKQSASSFVQSFTQFINEAKQDDCELDSIGIAFPGPFNYADGICQIYGVGGKFSNLFGLNLKAALQQKLWPNLSIYFANDAHCFALGCHQNLQLKNERAIYITLGTGFGSAFMENGHLIHADERIPDGGAFYYIPFAKGIADEYFSTRWFLQEAINSKNQSFDSVKDIVMNHTELAEILFAKFCNNFTDFMMPWLKKFNCEQLIIGGNIAKANNLFSAQLNQTLQKNGLQTKVVFVSETENMIMVGAACMADEESYSNNFPTNQFSASFFDQQLTFAKKNNQSLFPFEALPNVSHTIFPVNKVKGGILENGFISLAKKISSHSIVKMDGYFGVLWEEVRKKLELAFNELGIETHWYCMDSCLKEEIQLRNQMAASLNGDDPKFGKNYVETIDDYFDKEKILALQPDKAFNLCIIYGTGASLANVEAPIIYIDVPKNEIQ